MTAKTTDSAALAISLFSEILAADQMVRNRISRGLPKGMEISHFSVLHNLCWYGGERTPAQLATAFNVTRGAMTNTLSKLEVAGYIHIRPDWEDARQKLVGISPAGRTARDMALQGISPIVSDVIEQLGEEQVRSAIPILRELRLRLTPKG